jgi:hypothetical protein
VTAAGGPGSTTVFVSWTGLAFPAAAPTTTAAAAIPVAATKAIRRRLDVALQRLRNPAEPVVTTSTARSSSGPTLPMIVAQRTPCHPQLWGAVSRLG